MTLGIKRERYKFSVNMMEHYGRTCPKGKVTYIKAIANLNRKIPTDDRLSGDPKASDCPKKESESEVSL